MAHYLEDIRSDLSVLHRVDDMEKLPGPRFFSLVYRLGAYQSLIAARARQQKKDRPAPAQMSISQWMAAHPEAMDAARRQQEVDPGELQSR